MRYLARLLAVALLLLLVVPALAQGNLIVEDETGNLDRRQIEAAADPLLDRGATVAVYMVQQGDDADFRQRLQRDGLVRGDGLARTEMIAIYVSLNPRYSNIRFGEDWNAALAVNDNFDNIRLTQLNPALASSNFTQGYVDALRAIDQAIASPPRPGGGTEINVNFIPIVLGVFILLGLFVTWGVFSRRRSAARALAAARQRMEEARRAAGAAITDMGRQLQTAREKAEYDRVSYTPADVERLAQTQGEVEAQFVTAQNRFDDVNEALEQRATPTIPHYDEATQGYTQVAQMVTALRGRLEEINQTRVELDQLAQRAPGEIDRAKKNVSEVADQLASLQGEIREPEAVLAPIRQSIAQAEQALAGHDARTAIASAQAAVAQAEALAVTLERYTAIRSGIVQGRNDAERLVAQGYRMQASQTALDNTRATLTEAAQILQQRGVAATEPTLNAAQALLDEAIANGRGLVALRAENEQRLTAIEALGQQAAQAIVTGHQTFDIVDEFAESTWSDIRGNGSEAEAAADRAHEHWRNAQYNNTMDVQEFVLAKENLDAAEAELNYVQTLVAAITQRLKDLETARDTARDELEAAAADISQGWEFVRSHDPDVGKVPEQQLQQAEQWLAAARNEMAQAKPNWLELIKQAQAANNLADQALAGARSEVEAMEKLRTRAERVRTLAANEVQKIVQFAQVHRQDIQPANQSSIDRIQRELQAAHMLMQQAEQREEEARGSAFQQAYAHYTQLQTDAEQVYASVYADFQRLEQLRTEVNAELSRARNAIVSAENTLVEYGSLVPRDAAPVRTIRDVRRRFEQIRLPIDGEQKLQTTLRLARAIGEDARQAEAEIRRNYRRPPDNDAGEFIAGMVIGAMLDAASSDRHRHGGGWGGSGSWGGGGGSGGGGGGGSGGWGSLGGGGGSWGGGGGGGGSWGGGGGGGGGW